MTLTWLTRRKRLQIQKIINTFLYVNDPDALSIAGILEQGNASDGLLHLDISPCTVPFQLSFEALSRFIQG